jgi:hypothetical protein
MARIKQKVIDTSTAARMKNYLLVQGVISPMLANVYLHYVFDLWAEAWRKKVAKGDAIVVRYADDLVVGFESRTVAERFLAEFQERLAKFGLELHAEKTRLIEFGRFAASNRKRRGEGKPETFTFLGFSHYCRKQRSNGAFIVWRKTAKKRMVAKLHAIKAELRRRMHEPTASVGEGCDGSLPIPCGPRKPRSVAYLRAAHTSLVAAGSEPSQPKRHAALGSAKTALRALDSRTPCSASIPCGTFRRHSSRWEPYA